MMNMRTPSWIFVAVLAISGAGVCFADAPGPGINSARTYPPSCLSDPLPNDLSGPTVTGSLTLPRNDTGSETVVVTVGRSPCSGGQSALLARLARNDRDGEAPYPLFPAVRFKVGDQPLGVVRVAAEPNTVRSTVDAGTALGYSQTYVFERAPTGPQLAPSDAMAIYFYSPTTGTELLRLDLPAYDPAHYPQSALALPLTGYLSGNWFDPSHSGEGVQTEIGEAEGPNNRYIVFAWYTYDTQGTPSWLFGSGSFARGERSVDVELGYFSGGRFAGAPGGAAVALDWGRVSVFFSDCNTLKFSYAANSGLPSAVPQGAGTKQWTRLTSINGLACQ